MNLVVLGRDRLINQERTDGVARTDKWQPVPGSAEAVARLSRAGFRVVVATSPQQQSLVAREVEEHHDVHLKMVRLVQEAGGNIDAVFFTAGKRQPKRMVLRQIEKRYQVDMAEVTVIGDSPGGLAAAASVGANFMLVRRNPGAMKAAELRCFEGVPVFKDLAAAVDALISARTSAQVV